MLLCDQKTFYGGMTRNVLERLSLHKDRKSFFTKKFSDIELVYCERYENKHEAAKRE